ncbi:cell division protein FtsW [Gordonia polyisoprenivorans NBRC 16320 = JCM 10675]|uniref:Probable peptidoglycan glycosyltransferase FtsW n=1 Tax=Gordonia polyisoprenivorans TaxID=84595 RepID=A0A846WR23_9ACTN|nr:putative lipid II flippase FtsW [Gordonia polyisoprenivorans]NKY03436.1 putative lipid II flippase FtsW [Gordonia polyisoprenivorans]GAB23853.1 cell division protein FtsW [Gordonia polyisoprenivorans NBRC 16320 = JCM 10675]
MSAASTDGSSDDVDAPTDDPDVHSHTDADGTANDRAATDGAEDDAAETRETKPSARRSRSRADARASDTRTQAGPVEMVGTALSTIAEGTRSLLGRPLASYHLILTLAFLLTAFGLVMVLSASSVEGYSQDGSAYGLFATQVVFALLGVVVFYLTLRLPVRLLRRMAAPLMVITTVLLALVLIPGVGTLSQGARRWFVISGLSVQPSELVKVALCVWGAHLLASRRRDNAPLKELLIPLLPVGLLICLLIILEPNLSTTITIAIIIGTLLWFAGLPIKVFSAFALTGAGIAIVLALVEGYRSQRVMSFLGGIDDPQGAGYQARQATYALANGGVFGVGLGQSRAKWNYLPNAHNDFIFAIIGEELGLIGGLLVVALFVIFTFVGLRIAHRSTDPFLRLMTATITVLITTQALINIGYVIGLLPVTGIQLPLLSAGGTSTLTVLAMLGLLANAARHEPEAVVALSTSRPGRLGRILRLPTPVAYKPSRAEVLRDRLDGRRSGSGTTPAPARRGRPGPGRGPAPTPEAKRPMWRRVLPGGRRSGAAGQTAVRPAGATRGAGRYRAGAGSEASGPRYWGAGSEASGPRYWGAGSEASGPGFRGAGSEASGRYSAGHSWRPRSGYSGTQSRSQPRGYPSGTARRR